MLRSCTLLALAAACCAADPSGLVESVDGKALVLRFDATSAARLVPGCLVAIYGPGQVEKHPLTKEVIIERPRLVAKAQITALVPSPQARVVWQAEGAAPAVGHDAVAITELAPNAPPAPTAVPAKVTAGAGGQLLVKAPVADPDGDPLICTWELSDPGRSGRLDARTTTRPEIGWSAPLAAGEWKLTLNVRDRLGQRTSMVLPLAASEATEPVKRELRTVAWFGEGAEPAITRLRRAADGRWWGIDGDGVVWRCDPGWRRWEKVAFAEPPKHAAALAFHKDEVAILDASRGMVSSGGVVAVHAVADGAKRRTIGGLVSPTDVAVAPDGAVLVADQGAGGVQVFEPDGRPRLRLGRAGDGNDDFKGLLGIACDPDGGIYALDQLQRRVLRWDRFGRSLAPWGVPTDDKDPPVDCCVRPGGLLVLSQSGRVAAFDRDGRSAAPWIALGSEGLVSDPRTAAGIGADLLGEAVVAYPGRGVLARYAPDGVLAGVRGAPLRAGTLWAADAIGRLVLVLPDDHRLALLDPEGWMVGAYGARMAEGGPVKDPVSLAVSPSGRWAAVVDGKSRQVVRWDLSQPKVPPKVFSSRGESTGQLASPVSLVVDDAGRTWVLDDDTYRVTVFDAEGAYLFHFGSKGKGPAELYEPKLLAVTADAQVAYIYDAYRYEIKKFAIELEAKQTRHVVNSQGKGTEPGQLKDAVGLAVDRQGLVWVVDASREDLQILDLRGTSCLPVAARRLGDLDLRKPVGLALSPDGLAWLPVGKTAIAGVR
jgi:DNA-binding beta-propeller fold protein YncE